MKISLNLQQDGAAARAARGQVTDGEILAVKKGDWNAKHSLVRTFTPLLKTLAEKRSADVRQINKLMEAGTRGLLKAVKKYKPGSGSDRFQIFALNYIEAGMSRMQKGGGFLARLFGRR